MKIGISSLMQSLSMSIGTQISTSRRYGRVLLDVAQSSGPRLFTAGFSNGKKQLKMRLSNLFAIKKNSSAFVGIVLAAAILMSGMIGFENVQGVQRSSFTDKKERKLYEDYFYKHYNEDEASVVLADLSGDGKDEMHCEQGRHGCIVIVGLCSFKWRGSCF